MPDEHLNMFFVTSMCLVVVLVFCLKRLGRELLAFQLELRFDGLDGFRERGCVALRRHGKAGRAQNGTLRNSNCAT